MSKIVAYACSTRPNHLWSAAQFNNADPKNRTDCDIPLVTMADSNVYKAKSISRGKLLERFRCHVQEVVDHVENEGDRVYFGTTNHLDYLKDVVAEMEMWRWDSVIRERPETDPYEECRKLRRSLKLSEDSAIRLQNSVDVLREELDAMAKALERITALTPRAANAATANDLHLTIKAIADTALNPDRNRTASAE